MNGKRFVRVNLKIMTVFYLLCMCTACGRNGEEFSISEADLSRFRQFLSESMAFDYCGHLFTDNDVKRASERFSMENLVGFHLVERMHINLSIAYLHLLESFERNAMLGLMSDAKEDARRIKEALRHQRSSVLSPQKKFSPFSYERNVRQLLYSIVRIREFGRSREDFVRTVAKDVLGDELFDLDLSKCDWIHMGTDRFSRLQLFRDFVRLSFHITEAESDLPGIVAYAIGKIEDARLAGVMRKRGFRFVSERGKWTLLWSRAGFEGDFMKEFSLVPQVDGITCISDARTDLAGVVHLSSDFARRRQEIFRRGEILRGASLVVGKEFIVVAKSNRL